MLRLPEESCEDVEAASRAGDSAATTARDSVDTISLDSARLGSRDSTLSSSPGSEASFTAVSFATRLKSKAKNKAEKVANKAEQVAADALPLAKAVKAAALAAKACAENPEAHTLAAASSANEEPPPSAVQAVSRRDSALGLAYGARTVTAVEGVALLKRGCDAVKLTKKGRQRVTTFRLSEDESTLTWSGPTLAKLGQARAVHLADVVEVQVGQDSPVFERAKGLTYSVRERSASRFPGAPRVSAMKKGLSERMASSKSGGGSWTEKELVPHLSLSLLLIAGLPAPPSEMDDGDEQPVLSPNERGSLDVCVLEEEHFGLWVAALRALTTEARLRPTAYPSPMQPMHASAAASLAKSAPPDASLFEHMRDGSLRCLALYAKTKLFVGITVGWVLSVVIFGALYGFLLFGWHGMEADEATELGNAAIQVLTALFSYILFLTLPWRLANAIHLSGCSKRSCAAGVDLYGRPTNGIWFHIPPHKRRWIVALLCGNAFFQYATQATRFIWSSYDDSQSMPGVLWINLTFVLSIMCGISSGIWQGCAEGAVRKADPGRFPPTPVDFALEAWKQEREQQRLAREAGDEPQPPSERMQRRMSCACATVAAAAAMPAPRISIAAAAPAKRASCAASKRESLVGRNSSAQLEATPEPFLPSTLRYAQINEEIDEEIGEGSGEGMDGAAASAHPVVGEASPHDPPVKRVSTAVGGAGGRVGRGVSVNNPRNSLIRHQV